MLKDRVRCAVANPGAVAVSSTVTLGAAPTGYRSFLTAFGSAISAYFVLSDGAGRTITGVWTVNAGSPETATITEILWNDRLGSKAGETFSSACTAWCALPDSQAITLRASPLGGFRNLVINGNPLVNQRSYVSGSTTSAGNQYTLDRWRVVTSGQSVSWTDSAGVRTVTAPAGGMEQVIEGAGTAGLIGGTHTLSWTGTATATVAGASVANGGQVTLTGGSNITVRMTGGTWSMLQLEPGSLATLFERRAYPVELFLCQRYYRIFQSVVLFRSASVGTFSGGVNSFGISPTMRTSPTATLVLINGNYNNAGVTTTNSSVALSFSAGTVIGDWAVYDIYLDGEI